MTGTSKRINWIDWVKALGIFLVVIGHIAFPYNLIYFKKLIFSFHVPLFFLISGFLFKPESKFFKKSIRRLVIPYYAFNFIVFCIFIIPFYFIENQDQGSLLESLKMTMFGLQYPVSQPTWFILALFWSQMMNYYLLRFKPLVAIIGSVLIACLGYFIYQYFEEVNMPFLEKIPFFICQGMIATPLITLGYYLKKSNFIDIVFSKKIIVLLSFVVLVPFLLLNVSKLSMFDFVLCYFTEIPLLGILLAFIGCYFAFVFCRSLNKFSNKFIQGISNGTIIIIAFHLNFYLLAMKCFSYVPNIFISLFIYCIIMVICYFIIGFVRNNKMLSAILLGKGK